jgi:4-hydroxybenzoyl-CoA thioesterase
MKPFTYTQKVLFKHCDPAGIVFYPRYFEMMNDTVETFFGEVANYPFEDMHPAHGVPMAHIDVKFRSPSRHGDILNLQLSCLRLGRSSLDVQIQAVCDGQVRFSALATLVFINSDIKSTVWPAELRQILSRQLEGDTSV